MAADGGRMTVVEIINHYQKSIDKSLNDKARLLHCIAKLYRLPISVQHLQETGIGRTVNGLRKYDGEVGVAAKALVTKWKTMVAAEESDDGGEQDESHEAQDDSGHGDDGEDEDNYEESRLEVDERQQQQESDADEPQQDESDDQGDTHQNGYDSDQHTATFSGIPEQTQKHESTSERRRDDRIVKENGSSSSSSSGNSHRKSSSKDHKVRTDRDKDRSEGSGREKVNHHSSRKHSSSSSSKSSRHGDKDRKDKHSSKTDSSSTRKDSSQSKEKESTHGSSKEKHTSNEIHHSSSSKDCVTESTKRRRPSDEEDYSETKKVKKEKSSEKHRSSENSSSNSKKEKSQSSKSSSSGGSSREKDKKMSSKIKKESIKIKKEELDNSDEDVEGLDSAGGSSFADALAMIGMPSSSKKKSSNKGNVDKIKKSPTSMPPPATKIKKEKSDKSRDKLSPSSTVSSSSHSSCSSTPTLLAQKIKLEPLPEVSEIVESLPMISPHYKPMPLNQTVMECVFSNNGRPQKRQMTEEEALGHSMQSKNLRTKVYSGVKNSKEGVPKLFDLCIRLLQENIDLIDSFGGIPFDLLKPVIERATPQQLFNLEHFNPYLMEDTDTLWELQCKRTFRSQKRKEEECESWREMYIRCSEERDAKLKSLTQNIKQSIEEKKAPVRKTQLAYVDSAVKPPRNVLSKQVKYGTDRTPVVSPAARVAALKNATSNVAKAGDSRLKVVPGARDNAQVQVFQPMKPKKAPLMAKLMTSIKGFKTGFRR
ncbi:transcription elongation factor B polypeptide 3 [Topomyia yanbarensis]|uniref:transcription elongation factor B polypeptide 3 n=1 Tax=Topomyia yanbarensis TaxID=2498891 RepID=UPI00273B1D18|nr:transcription elongation factor B polypeptide 3 [Topomyia yanbarensis]